MTVTFVIGRSDCGVSHARDLFERFSETKGTLKHYFMTESQSLNSLGNTVAVFQYRTLAGSYY
jgi:hypothetical protein